MSFVIEPVSVVVTPVIGTSSALTFIRNDFQQCLETDLLDTFFNLDEFAENIQYRHRTGETAIYAVIFDSPFFEARFDSEASGIDQRIELQIQETTLIRPIASGDYVTLRGKEYRVTEARSDGVGVTTMWLTVD